MAEDGGSGVFKDLVQNSANNISGLFDQIRGGGSVGVLPWSGGSRDGNSDGDEDGSRQGGGGGWGYGGYGSSGPTDNQKDAFGNLGAIAGENADILKDAFDTTTDVLDEAQKGNQYLRDMNMKSIARTSTADWYKDYMGLQGVYTGIKKKNDAGFSGSLLYDMNDTLSNALDVVNSNILNTMRENRDSVLASYYESLMQNINSRNESAADTEKALKELYSDYVAQGNNIHPDLIGDLIDKTGHGLNAPPDWLDTDFYESHKASMPKPEESNFILPDQAHEQIRQQGLSKRDNNIASAAMSSYWDRLNRGYDQRGRQA